MKLILVLLAAGAVSLRAQPGQIPQYDQASVDRGRTGFTAACGFCHGASARGGESGPDLLRSVLVLDDEGGKQLGEFLRNGRPASGMPAFTLPPEQVTDIATFLHSQITAAAYRRTYQIRNILVGDAASGEAFFHGGGGCAACHSSSGDLQGIGAKYDPVTLQGKIVMPRPSRVPSAAAPSERTGPSVKVTVTVPSGEVFRGDLVRITDFDVTLRDANRATRTFPRTRDVPRVVLTDPLQAHLDLLSRYTDKNIHDLTAYLVTLK